MPTNCTSPSIRRRVSGFIKNLDTRRIDSYLNYWQTLAPKTHDDYFNMWLFAFMSIHTSWEANVQGFLAIKDLARDCTYDRLRQAIINSRVGLHGTRTNGIWEFRKKFWENPERFYPAVNESMAEFRDRISKSLFGIGMAKTSFVLEMAYPKTCDVVCLDTHILQLYGYPVGTSPGLHAYHVAEKHWIGACKRSGVPSPMARHIYWDDKQGKNDTRYWSYVLEQKTGDAESPNPVATTV